MRDWTTVPLRKLISPSSRRNRPDLPLLSVVRDKGIIKRKLDKSDNHNIIPEDLSNYKVVLEGQFVINKMKAWQGSCGVSPYEGIVSPAYFVFDLEIDNPRFFNYAIRSRAYIDEFNRISSGIRVDQWDLSLLQLKYIRFPLPPREEQDQIVRYLDWKVSLINKLINAKRRQIGLLQEQKQAVINEAVTKGLNRNTALKHSEVDWIGYIPEHWDTRTLFGIATEQEVPNKGINNQNLLSLSYGKIISKDINTTDGLLPASFDTYQIVYDGNIILRLTDLQNDHKSLRVGLSNQTGIITSAYLCLNVRRGILPSYVYYLLHSYDICKVFYGMGGGVRQSIGYKDIRKIPMLVPPIDEQQNIVQYLDKQTKSIEKIIEKANEDIGLLSEYRTRLISDVVTGKLDVRGAVVPEYEAVEEAADIALSEDDVIEAVVDEETTPETLVAKRPATAAKSKSHNQYFDDAVMIAAIVDAFYHDKYPLGRKKTQKLLYLLRRHQEENTSAFKKKAAGPYADEIRYKGGEPIAVSNKYIKTTSASGKGTTFSKGANLSQALDYIVRWGINTDIQWLVEKFRFTSVDILELYATVDMAICDLTETNIPVSLATIKHLIETNAEWKAKLKKQTFSDEMINKAVVDLAALI